MAENPLSEEEYLELFRAASPAIKKAHTRDLLWNDPTDHHKCKRRLMTQVLLEQQISKHHFLRVVSPPSVNVWATFVEAFGYVLPLFNEKDGRLSTVQAERDYYALDSVDAALRYVESTIYNRIDRHNVSDASGWLDSAGNPLMALMLQYNQESADPPYSGLGHPILVTDEMFFCQNRSWMIWLKFHNWVCSVYLYDHKYNILPRVFNNAEQKAKDVTEWFQGSPEQIMQLLRKVETSNDD